MMRQLTSEDTAWPALPFEAWTDTRETLHRWLQIVGKVRLALTPWVNHSWHATLYVTARGLTTSVIPFRRRSFQIDADFIDHELVIATGEGETRRIALTPKSVATMYRDIFSALDDLQIELQIHGTPNELDDAIPFHRDHAHRAYDSEYARRFWQTTLHAHRVLSEFRTGYLGKVSPVHLFWGALDLAVTRFSGRLAPPHPGGVPHLPDEVTREAYSHEVSSAGFWPGGGGLETPAFYSYAYPESTGFPAARIEPAEAWYHEGLSEFVLPYDVVRKARDPEATLLAFFRSTYDAAASLGNWDRKALECPLGRPRVPRTTALP